MSGSNQDESPLSYSEATRTINEIAANLATRVIATRHAFERQGERSISLDQCITALKLGSVTERRSSNHANRVSYLYSVEYTDEIGPLRIIVRIKSDKCLIVITVIAL